MENVETTNNSREQALLDFLGLGEAGLDDLGIEPLGYEENGFSVDGGEYLVLTDSEADERAADYIKDSLWAFNADFLAGETGLDSVVFASIQNNGHCETNNPAMEALIKSTCGIESLIDSAISADGRGHFMSSYDGEENESGEYFIYRVN